MPMLEHGDIARVARNAAEVAAGLKPWIEKGYDVIALVPSCALMLKFEWPLIVTDNDDVKLLSRSAHDIAEYVVDIAKSEGLAPGLKTLEGGITVHLACHARAQNLGPKAAELLRLLPDTDVQVIERCSGHGGSWGIKSENFDVAIKQGRPVARAAAENAKRHVVSECPLAGLHILQGMERIEGANVPPSAPHPIQLIAQAYGL
jgi:glycerol-3-phosphate dehydrogenase subunit C